MVTTILVLCASFILGCILTLAFSWIFTPHKNHVNPALFMVQSVSFMIIAILMYYWPEQSEQPLLPDYSIHPEYIINLEQDSIHICTDHNKCFTFHADSIDIDEFIIQDNL
jgi:hypothetical protein